MTDFEKSKNEFIEFLDKSEFVRNLELEFIEMTPEYVKARMPFKDKFLNPYGTVHGGVLYALADTVAGALACLNGSLCTTIDGHLNYLEPAINTKYIYCVAKRIRAGKHLVYVTVEVLGDDGKKFDDGVFNFFKIDSQ